MLRRLAAGALAALVLSSCASTYKGPYPNYGLTGEARQKELQRFTLKEGYWNQGANIFQMGEPPEIYWASSLKPVVQEVSPRAWNRVEKSRVWGRVGNVFLLAAIGMLVAELVDGDGEFFNRDQTIAYYSLLGVSITTSFVRVSYMNRAARDYNEDLRAKFAPTVGMNFSF